MVNFIFAQLLILLSLTLSGPALAKMDRAHSEVLLGERNLDSYSERWHPNVHLDLYQGKLSFTDETFLQNYFQSSLFDREKELDSFLRSELSGAMSCTNEQLSTHFDDLRYSYRLLTLSYLLEGQWHLNMVSKHFAQKSGCRFSFDDFIRTCRPKSAEMTKFLDLLMKHKPKYEETLPKTYIRSDWWKDFKKQDFKYYSHYRLDTRCQGKCEEKDLEAELRKTCEEDQSLMNLICSETDEVYGVSGSPDAFNLVTLSNIINPYNTQGEAQGCLRRFSMVMAHKEVRYPVLEDLFQTLRAHLTHQYQERFLQGRVFFYGSGREFEEKGLNNLYIMEQPLKIAELDAEPPIVPEPELIPQKPAPAPVPKPVVKITEAPKKAEKIEIPVVNKSAFLQASEIRKAQDLKTAQVDMEKLRYDYVFSLNMVNNLSVKLKSFMTREALKEMVTYDKLGLKDGPVPLLFVKFMIDMHEHTGLYNLINVVGEEFVVSNEIDEAYKPELEKVRLVNNQSTGGQWQLFVIRQ